MSTLTQIIYHIVFRTRENRRALIREHREELYRYIWGIIQNKQCRLFRIGGIEDHVHLVIFLHPTVALADLVKTIKTSSSKWMKDSGKFAEFIGWQDGYGAFTVSHSNLDAVVNYVKNQEEHHKNDVSYKDELRRMLMQEGVEWDEKYLD